MPSITTKSHNPILLSDRTCADAAALLTFLRTLVVAAAVEPDVVAQVLHTPVRLTAVRVRTAEVAFVGVLGHVTLQLGVRPERPRTRLRKTGGPSAKCSEICSAHGIKKWDNTLCFFVLCIN